MTLYRLNGNQCKHLPNSEQNWRLFYSEFRYATFVLLHKPNLFTYIILLVKGTGTKFEIWISVTMKTKMMAPCSGSPTLKIEGKISASETSYISTRLYGVTPQTKVISDRVLLYFLCFGDSRTTGWITRRFSMCLVNIFSLRYVSFIRCLNATWQVSSIRAIGASWVHAGFRTDPRRVKAPNSEYHSPYLRVT
jgi:hypothetical protein